MVGQAISLPRAVGAFRAIGWDVMPYPAGYFTTDAPEGVWPPDLAGGLKLAGLAAHEWVGLLAYRLTGYSNEIFPG